MPPIFRTGLINFCHTSSFWHCILPFFYTSQSLELYNSTSHSNLVFHSFPANTFRIVLYYTCYPQFFSLQFHRIVLLHFFNAAIFLNCTNTLLLSGPILELYPSIFPHKPIFGTYYYTYHYIFLIHGWCQRFTSCSNTNFTCSTCKLKSQCLDMTYALKSKLNMETFIRNRWLKFTAVHCNVPIKQLLQR